MKNISLILLCLFLFFNAFTDEVTETTIYNQNFYPVLFPQPFVPIEEEEILTTLPPRMHELFALESSMSIQYVSEMMAIPLNRFISYFRINMRDPRILESSLESQHITVDQVYQLYCIDIYGYNDDSTLYEVSQLFHIPFKRFAGYLGVDPQDARNRSMTVRESGHETLDMFQYNERFKHETLNFNSTLIVMGMFVVFTAMLIISLIISKLTVFEKKTKEIVKIATTPIGTIKTESTEHLALINLEDCVCAIVAAVHRFKSEVASDHKILLTYRRIDVSMWQASGKVEMPNKHFDMMRRIK